VSTRIERGVLDTSVFVALETGRTVARERLPSASAVSAVTLGELHAGVLAAADVAARSQRFSTLEAVLGIELLPVDGAVAAAWGRLRAQLVEAGRRLNVNDAWIAATALAHDLPVVTQDADFDAAEGLGGLVVVRV
jgi:predicted nucleic acid-binding protein